MNASPPVTAAAPRRSRRGWWLLAGLAFGLPLAAGLLLWWWCGTQTDLDAAESRLRAAGLPTNGREWGRIAATPERLAAARRIGILANALDTYRNDYWDMRPEVSVSAGIRAFQDSRDAVAVAELEDTLLGIGDQPFAPTADFQVGYGDDLNSYRSGHFLRQRVLAAPVPEAERAARAALAVLRLQQGRPYVYSWLSDLDRAIINRMANGALFSPALAADLEATADRLVAGFPRDLAAQPIIYVGLFRTGFNAAGKTLGISLPKYMEFFPLNELIFRGGRGGLIDGMGDYAAYVRSHERVRDWVDEAQRESIALRGRGMLSPVALLSYVFLREWQYSYALSLATNVLRTRLIAAEMRLRPWPEDLLDRRGHALRPLVLHGRVIGGYSVGFDGNDDGGSRHDQRFPLTRKPLGTIGE